MTENTMAKRTNNDIYKTLHRKLKIEQNKPPLKTGGGGGTEVLQKGKQ